MTSEHSDDLGGGAGRVDAHLALMLYQQSDRCELVERQQRINLSLEHLRMITREAMEKTRLVVRYLHAQEREARFLFAYEKVINNLKVRTT